ncbi:MAG TPA: sigma factor-like helix-turn-helix DNA-binding protein, partial [Gemmataceae bacterium]|nr:sigma factor-like helix-turn-helix DNA-binding protein [Gemmataceae bacterium]
RRAREKQVKEMPEPQAPAEDAWPELRLVLDQELSRLPDKYRVPIVLCDLEGKTHKEAARHLGWPPGTVSGRLARARALLAGRLARRGVAFSTGALAVALAANTALACVSPSLISSTVKAASLWAAGQAASAGVISAQVAALTEGVLKAMLLTRLKVMGVLAAAVCVAALGGGALAHRCLAGPPLDRQAVSPPGGDREPTDAQARAPAEPAEEGTTVTGTLQAVDTDKNSVTVSTFSRKEGQSTETSFPVARDAAILRDGKEVKFSDLKKGGHVTLKLSPDPKTVVSLSVTGPTISAPLKSVDAEKNTLTITVENRQGKQDKTYQVAKDARVADEGKEAKLTDLKEGTTVILTLSVDDGNTIIHVRTPSRRGPGKNE